MKRNLTILFSGITSGLLIAIGGSVFLSLKTDYYLCGSLFFAFGLMSIILLKLYLYTGKIGYLTENPKSYIIDLLMCLIGNAIGAIGTGYLFNLMNNFDNRVSKMIDTATSVANIKLDSNWFNILILSFFCGIMIFLAVEISKRDIHPVFKLVAIFLAVAIFILCGFEHCIANMFYFSAANAWSLKTLLYVFLMIVGNSLGSIFIYYLIKLAKL